MVLIKIPYMNYITNHFLSIIPSLTRSQRLSERVLAKATGLSRTCIRHIMQQRISVSLSSVKAVCDFLNLDFQLLISGSECHSEFSTVAISYRVERDGFDSWKIHFMDFVDQFRRQPDPRLILLPPPKSLDQRLVALLASLVRLLAREQLMSAPRWAEKRYFLETPWFPAEMHSLKASAIIESPVEFRNNNIYVLNNFASRA